MTATTVERSVLTFLFTDIAGSTRLWDRAPVAMERALARHDATLHTITALHRGRVFKTIGDAFCCRFEHAHDAVRAAVAMQRALLDEPWPSDIGTLAIRIGIHTGEAVVGRDDFFGNTLNRVARLMAAGHGGQILLSETTAALVRDALGSAIELRDLGTHRLRDVRKPQRIYQVVAAGLPDDFAQIASADARPNNLPSHISSFIGRREDREQVRQLLRAARLVTICGAGGIGKTRLAVQVAADMLDEFKDGAWIVRLADIDDTSLIPQSVAAVLHLDEVPSESLVDTIVNHLSNRRALLLLDNAEHVLPGAALLVKRILSACPDTAVLVTSREPLHINGERTARIGPMIESDAVQLFVERAELSTVDESVKSIARRLDGVPLAIELVAANALALGARAIDERLVAILPRLRSKDPTQEERHRTLRAAVEWSYRLLTAGEQQLFARLAIFEGGFTLEACEAVAGSADILGDLVDKSFVSVYVHEEPARYHLLESLCVYARERLGESGERDTVAAQHFAYFEAFAHRWGTWESQEEERAYLAAVNNEMPNLRAALEWGFAQPDKTAAFALLQKVASYWQQRCHIAEARSWYERALALEAPPEARARMLRRAATFATIADDYVAARNLTQEALDIFQLIGDGGGMAEAQHNLAVIEHRSGSTQAARELYELAFRGFVDTGHRVGQITALYNLGQVALGSRDLDAAKNYLEDGMALCGSSAEHSDRLATFLTALGDVALRRRDMDTAQHLFERALAKKRELGGEHDEVEVLRNLSTLSLRRGDSNAAAAYAFEALEIARRLRIDSLLIGCFELYAVILMQTGQEKRARQAFVNADSLRRKVGYVYVLMNEIEPELGAIRAQICDEDRVHAAAAGDQYAFIEELLRS